MRDQTTVVTLRTRIVADAVRPTSTVVAVRWQHDGVAGEDVQMVAFSLERGAGR